MSRSAVVLQSVMCVLGRWLLTSILAGAVSMSAFAQDALAPQTDFPKDPQQNEWYFNQVQHKVWVHRGSEWQPFPCEDCRSVKLCNDHAIVKDGFHYMLATQSGRVVVANAPAIRCLDDFIVLGAHNRIEYLLDAAGDTVSALVNNCKIYTDTLKGDIVYCFPRYSPGLEKYNCSQLRNWGMMDVSGNWRIEPRFDKPFHFSDGVAGVWFMGMPRRIDEDGRFLEDLGVGESR